MAGSQCCENPPQPEHPSVRFQGRLETFAHLNAYVSGSPDAKKAVILVSDVYGFEAPNLRKLADKVATYGYLVLVPDYFYGDPFVRPSSGDHSSSVQDWLSRHGTEKGFEDSRKLIEVLKSRGITSIGASGFCWGAKAVVELAKGDYIKAAVLLHPSLIMVDDFKVVKVPIAILAAEFDNITPPELIEQYEAILSARPEVDSFVKVYSTVAHGWAVRYSNEDEVAVKNAEEAHTKMLEWFSKYLEVTE